MNTTKGNIRPKRPKSRLDERVNDRLQALLARVQGIRRGSTTDRPTKFDARGEAHACSVAERDRERTNGA